MDPACPPPTTTYLHVLDIQTGPGLDQQVYDTVVAPSRALAAPTNRNQQLPYHTCQPTHIFWITGIHVDAGGDGLLDFDQISARGTIPQLLQQRSHLVVAAWSESVLCERRLICRRDARSDQIGLSLPSPPRLRRVVWVLYTRSARRVV